MTFVGMIGSIQAMAYGVVKQYGGKFAVDELVNEAWIQSLGNNHTDPPLIMRAAQLDIRDYIRKHMGRKYAFRNGKKLGGIFKPKYMTNIDTYRTEEMEHSNSFFDRDYYDKNLNYLENDELIDVLLSKTTTKRAIALIYYYLGDNNMMKTSIIIGRSEGHTSNMLKRGRAECNKALVNMKLEYAEI